MLKGLRVAVKYLTIGLLAGLLLAPRKGDETRTILVDRAREYIKELMGAAQQAGDEATGKSGDMTYGSYETEHRAYDSTSGDNVQ